MRKHLVLVLVLRIQMAFAAGFDCHNIFAPAPTGPFTRTHATFQLSPVLRENVRLKKIDQAEQMLAKIYEVVDKTDSATSLSKAKRVVQALLVENHWELFPHIGKLYLQELFHALLPGKTLNDETWNDFLAALNNPFNSDLLIRLLPDHKHGDQYFSKARVVTYRPTVIEYEFDAMDVPPRVLGMYPGPFWNPFTAIHESMEFSLARRPRGTYVDPGSTAVN